MEIGSVLAQQEENKSKTVLHTHSSVLYINCYIHPNIACTTQYAILMHIMLVFIWSESTCWNTYITK